MRTTKGAKNDPEPFTNHAASQRHVGWSRPSTGMGEATPFVGKWENPDTSAACSSSGAALNFNRLHPVANRKEKSDDNRR